MEAAFQTLRATAPITTAILSRAHSVCRCHRSTDHLARAAYGAWQWLGHRFPGPENSQNHDYVPGYSARTGARPGSGRPLLGNFASRLRVFNTENNIATLAQVHQHIAEDANGQYDNWSALVPNPYYNVPAFANTGCGSQTTIPGISLLSPLSQYCNGAIYQYNDPIGKTWYNALEVKLTKRAGRGLTFNLSYTYSKTMQATSFNGVGPSNGYGNQSGFGGGEFPWDFLARPTRLRILIARTCWLYSGVEPALRERLQFPSNKSVSRARFYRE